VTILGLLVATLLLSATLFPSDLTVEQREDAIESISLLLAENYVYQETAQKMAEVLSSKLKSGLYESLSDPEKFAEAVMRDLREVSKDRHLRVMYDPEAVKRLREAEKSGPDPERRKEMLKQQRRRNFGFEQVEILPGNIGYLELLSFSGTPEAGETATAAMNFLSNSDAVIIDLRRNGGGSPSMIQLISSYLFEPEPKHLNSFYWRPKDETTQTWTLPHVPGRRNPDVPVYVLTSNRTFSAAEEFTYNLKNMERATIVGETTGGGAHPGGTMPANDEFVVWVPQGRAINPVTQTNWEGTGVAPDIAVPASGALERAHIEALKTLAEKAESEDLKFAYRWAKEDVEARLEAVQVDPGILRSYLGTFGPRKITWADGSLQYQRENGPVYKMIPMSKGLFRFEEAKYFRLRILEEDGKVVAVEGLYDNGQKDRNAKDK
jgi:hypothetical protein